MQLAQGLAEGGEEIAVVVARDEVRDDLCVGLRDEGNAFRLQLSAQGPVVFHDAVMDDSEPTR